LRQQGHEFTCAGFSYIECQNMRLDATGLPI
jgi:hypothetical protein